MPRDYLSEVLLVKINVLFRLDRLTFRRLFREAYSEEALRPRVVVVFVELIHQVRVFRVFLRVLL